MLKTFLQKITSPIETKEQISLFCEHIYWPEPSNTTIMMSTREAVLELQNAA